ncbi:MAG: excinuclease ABC subunit C [Bacteroidales bacterium]|nr:excinuclease ABC subunit C [Bacteroidales bacterium]
MKQLDNIKKQLEHIPHQPGVYKYLDQNNTILYVGKAKDLKKRVSSYWKNIEQASGKIKVLISKTVKIEYIITNSEADALLLENNLIKTLHPRYNILLKDDKTYPWIKVTNEEFPQIFKTRLYTNDGSQYFGPYPSVTLMYLLLDLIKKLFSIRSCKLPLTEDSISKNKFKECLEFHIGNCLAPCVGKQTKQDYNDKIQLALKILKGDLKPVRDFLYDKMKESADKLLFEQAAFFKNKLDLLDQYQSKSIIVNPKLHDIDVFSFDQKNNLYFINFIKIMHGSVVQSHNLTLSPQLNESKEEILWQGILHIRELFNSNSNEIVVPFNLNLNIKNIIFTVPKAGDKLKLLQLSFSNLTFFIHQYTLNKLKANYGNVNVRLLNQVKNDLKLQNIPVRMECFDNSHHQGDELVASCVVFINGKPAKSEYRHFKIKTVDIPDDFASMREVIFRRYKRLLEENKPLPHLIVIDGGKGQLSAALESLKILNITEKIEIISIAKKLEEIYKPNDSLPLYIDKRSETLKLIQRIRNEAHRFAISFHRQLKLNHSFSSILDEISGIGNTTKTKLLKQYTSIDKIAEASKEELVSLIGTKRANIVWNFFHKE